MTQDEFEEECSPAPDTEALSRELHIVNRKGLHARATAKFVQCVDRFDADVKVTRGEETVGGDSIMGILTLGAGPGSIITVTASGAEAREALEALACPVGNLFLQLFHRLVKRRPQRVIAGFREHVAGRDQMNADLIGGTRVLQSHQSDVRLVNLPLLPEGKDLFLHPGIERVQGTNVQVLHVESHGRCHVWFG